MIRIKYRPFYEKEVFAMRNNNNNFENERKSRGRTIDDLKDVSKGFRELNYLIEELEILLIAQRSICRGE